MTLLLLARISAGRCI